jgi:hypothetical protein
MRHIFTTVLAVVLPISVGIFYFTRPGQPPAGQPPLVEITSQSLDGLHAEFNRTSSGLRIILLLSPT